MDKEFSLGGAPACDTREESLVVAHVFEHLDRHDAVKATRRLKFVHVCRHDFNGGHCSSGTLALDKFALPPGVGDRQDAALRVMLGDPERERAPAAAEVEDIHPVPKLRACTTQTEHRVFRGIEGDYFWRPITAAVFQPPAEDLPKECGRDFVVLFVGLVGV